MAIMTMAPRRYANKRIDFGGPEVIIRGELIKDIQLRNFFQMHDRNGDGVLGKNELTAAFRLLGVIAPGRRASQSLLYAVSNSDGRVSTEQELDKLVEYAVNYGYSVQDVGRGRYKL